MKLVTLELLNEPEIIPITNKTDKLQITHMQHPYNNGDNISMELDWKTNLSRTSRKI